LEKHKKNMFCSPCLEKQQKTIWGQTNQKHVRHLATFGDIWLHVFAIWFQKATFWVQKSLPGGVIDSNVAKCRPMSPDVAPCRPCGLLVFEIFIENAFSTLGDQFWAMSELPHVLPHDVAS
jgi:hypothetical protein